MVKIWYSSCFKRGVMTSDEDCGIGYQGDRVRRAVVGSMDTYYTMETSMRSRSRSSVYISKCQGRHFTCKTTSTIASSGGSSSRWWYLYRRSRTFLMDPRVFLSLLIPTSVEVVGVLVTEVKCLLV